MEQIQSENVNGQSRFLRGVEVAEQGIVEVVLRHRRLILLVTGSFLVIAMLYILGARRIYRSESRLYVEQAGPRIISDYEGAPARVNSYLYTQAEMIKSSPVVSEVANDPAIRRFRTLGDVDNVTAYLQKNLDVSIGKKDDIITVGFDSAYAEEAAEIVNSVVDSYMEAQSIRKKDVVSTILRILQAEKTKSDREVSEKWQKLVEFTRDNGAVSLEDNTGNVAYQKLIKLSEAMTESQIESISASAELAAMKSVGDDPVRAKELAVALRPSGAPVFLHETQNQLEWELQKAKLELRSIRNHITEAHPAAKALKAQIEMITGRIEENARVFVDAYMRVTDEKLRTAKEKEKTLAALFETQLKVAQRQSVDMAEYAMLQSELKRAERFDEVLDDRIKTLNVMDTEYAGKLNIHILEVAHPAEQPCSPEKAKVMGLALLLGLMCGMGVAFGREWMDMRLRSVDEISSVLGLAVLGVVPSMEGEQKLLTRGQEAWAKCRACAAGMGRAVEGILRGRGGGSFANAAEIFRRGRKDISSVNKADVISRGQKVYIDPKSTIAESYRTIRTAIFFGIAKGEARTILVTSPEAGDGKSTLVSNLGLAMAQAGQKTLIIDADFRRPMQQSIFDIEGAHGISSVLAGEVSIDHAIKPGPILGLDVLCCGPEVPNPSEILNSDAFVQLLREELCVKYSRIIIDSPPVGPVTDSQILAAVCDVTLLVLRADKSTRKTSTHACEVLRNVGGRLHGVVVNDVPEQRRYGGYYSLYGYRSGSSYRYHGNRDYQNDAEKRENVYV